MPYTRKTQDEYQIQQYTGPQYGWECVTAGSPIEPPPGTPAHKRHGYASGRQDALNNLKLYRENDPRSSYRLRVVRVPITPTPERK